MLASMPSEYVDAFFNFYVDGALRIARTANRPRTTRGLDRLELIWFPPGRSNNQRAPRCAGLPGRHQRIARLLSSRGADRGLHRDTPQAPGLAPGRQGQHTGHHAPDRPSAPRAGGLPGRTHRRRLILRPLTGTPIDRRDCYRMVVRIAKASGISRHISPHSLRHAAITNALDASVPLPHCLRRRRLTRSVPTEPAGG